MNKDFYKKGFKYALLRNLSYAIIMPIVVFLTIQDKLTEDVGYNFKLFLFTVGGFGVFIFIITYINWAIYSDD